jgi:hypothetical protein
VQFRPRPRWRVLNDLIDKLETLPAHHPDRLQPIETILGLRGELDAPRGNVFAGTWRPAWPLDHRGHR